MMVLTITVGSCSTQMDMEDLALIKESKIQNAKAFVSKMQFKLQVTPVEGQSLRSVFKVSSKDLQSLLASRQTSRISASEYKTIEPVVYKQDTIMYLVCYAKGWKLYSTDKRMPLVLAENNVETGKKAAEILNNKSIGFWIEEIANCTKYLAQTDDYDENSENLSVWATQGRSIKRIPYQPVPGEYIYVGREVVERYPKNIPHVTKTQWHRTTPFNYYCPTKSKSSEERCLTGCVSVAVAQYMYYLQDKKGYSFTMPQIGICVGAYDENYIQDFSSMATWDLTQLALTDNTYLYSSSQLDNVALALAYVGKGVKAKYGPESSAAYFQEAQSFLNKNGVKGKFVDGLDISVNRTIRYKEPIIARGEDSQSYGHMFLIDGCKYDSVVYEDVWRFLEDTTFYDPDRYGVILRERGTYESNYLYQLNLGWNLSLWPGGSDTDDTYYNLSNLAGYNEKRRYFKREN